MCARSVQKEVYIKKCVDCAWKPDCPQVKILGDKLVGCNEYGMPVQKCSVPGCDKDPFGFVRDPNYEQVLFFCKEHSWPSDPLEEVPAN